MMENIENQGLVHRPLRDKLREHWNTRDEILQPKPEKANSMGMIFSWVYSMVLTITISYIILPDLDHGIWHQLVSWLLFFIVMQNWRLCRCLCRATTERVPQPQQAIGEISLPEDWKHCAVCQLYSPPRTHHCKVCGVCVMKRDHHCFFTGTCIGFHNQRHFVIFMFYTIIGSLNGICLLTLYLTECDDHWTYHWYNYLPGISFFMWLFGQIPLGQFFLLMELYASCIVFLSSLGFYIWEVCMIFRGQTSFEAAHHIDKYRSSPLASLRSTFGPYGLVNFLIPGMSLQQEGDGVNWPVYKYYKAD